MALITLPKNQVQMPLSDRHINAARIYAAVCMSADDVREVCEYGEFCYEVASLAIGQSRSGVAYATIRWSRKGEAKWSTVTGTCSGGYGFSKTTSAIENALRNGGIEFAAGIEQKPHRLVEEIGRECGYEKVQGVVMP